MGGPAGPQLYQQVRNQGCTVYGSRSGGQEPRREFRLRNAAVHKLVRFFILKVPSEEIFRASSISYCGHIFGASTAKSKRCAIVNPPKLCRSKLSDFGVYLTVHYDKHDGFPQNVS